MKDRTEVLELKMTRQRALELGLLVCTCTHRENNHFNNSDACAHCRQCKRYVERGITGVELVKTTPPLTLHEDAAVGEMTGSEPNPQTLPKK